VLTIFVRFDGKAILTDLLKAICMSSTLELKSTSWILKTFFVVYLWFRFKEKRIRFFATREWFNL